MYGLTLSQSLIDELHQIAGAASPMEACAVLIGTKGHVTSFIHIDNVAADPMHFFDMDTQQLIDAYKEARQLGTPIIGIWHSHPGGPALPSRVDSDKAYDASLIWLISAPKANAGWQSKCYQAPAQPGGKFRELSLNLVK